MTLTAGLFDNFVAYQFQTEQIVSALAKATWRRSATLT